MPAPFPNAVVCATCGTRLETTTSGDLVCLACFLRSGLGEPDRSDPEEVPDSLGTYRLERHEDGKPRILGRGAMGITYCARDVSLDRKVALKIINAQFALHGSEARERFVREARAAASLHHPNVATVYQFGIDEETGQCFCAMEYIDGETLEERVGRSGPLQLPTVVEIARQIVAALSVAEKHGIVHRDLKPGNVMITASDQPEKIAIKIIDFGLAKALAATPDARLLTDGGFLGTPAFASPEQLRRAPVDVRSDIYSLGVTLWYLLTGQLPVIDREPAGPPIAQLKAARVPSPFIALLVSMLATEPAARPAAHEIAARLQVMPRRGARVPALASAGLALAALALAFYVYLSRPATQPIVAVPEKSIAVLPFENLSNEKESANFADGVQDELLTDLSHIAELKVVSRTSVMQYRRGAPRNMREIGGQLGVAYVVEGTVRIAARKVRISAQLIDARTDLHRWAQVYDRPIDDLLAIQSEIAQTIAGQLGVKIAPQEKTAIEQPLTHDVAAFDLYTRARALLSDTSFSPRGKENLLEATQFLAEAVARDPNFLLAYCQMAKAHDALYFLGFDHTPPRLSLGEAAVNAALKLQPEAGEAHLARARHLYQGYLAYEPALAELEIARRTLPNHPGVFTLAGYIYRRQGKWDESAREFENALALDPRNVDILQQSSISYNLLRRYADTAIVLDRALQIAPDNIELSLARAQVDLNWRADIRPLHQLVAAILARNPVAARDLAGASLLLGFCERDQAATRSALAALGDGSFGPDALQLRRIFWEGLAAKVRGDPLGAQRSFSDARAEQERMVEGEPGFAPALCILGLIDAGLGRKSEAIREGRRAVEMLPVSRDPINGAHMIEFLAIIYAWTGEPALACDQLETVTKIPGTLSFGQLRLSPMWDDLRSNPRFEKIVASLAPDDAR
ncbi:MAG: protein kinase domain-containing protein [Chthoniobacterales bacterium]